jgi:excinuclease UvrABC nuclease subunit
VLARKLTFSPELDEGFFAELPAAPAVFLLRGSSGSGVLGAGGEPYVSKTANLRRRLQRLLGVPAEKSKRLNLRDRVCEIEFTPTGSDFESQFLLYRVLRETFPKTYAARLRLRPAPLIKLHLENDYPRASVTTRLGRLYAPDFGGTGASPDPRDRSSTGERASSTPSSQSAQGEARVSRGNLYYGPFASRYAAEKFTSDVLDFFKMRRCVEDLDPDPSFPGCVYSEMKMCLAPCFKGCTDAAYQVEVARVQRFFDTAGESLTREFAEQRDRASAELAFEEAAASHNRIEKLKPLLAQLPEIVRRIDLLDTLIVQTATEPGAVALFRFRHAALSGPVMFNIEFGGEPRSMESRIEELITSFPLTQTKSAAERTEQLAILKRWYYRSTRVGEIFFADEKGSWPLRRIVRGIGRVFKGEKAQEQGIFSATEGRAAPS